MEIYKLTSPSGKTYIGKAAGSARKRWNEHKYAADHSDLDYPIYRAIRKYGWESFTKEVIDTARTVEELLEKEIYWIQYFKSDSIGYNVLPGGDLGRTGVPHSEETKALLSTLKKGIPLSEQHKESLRGLTRTEEQKLRMSEADKKRVVKPEDARKRGDTLRRIGHRPPSAKGRPMSDATKQLHSERMRGNTLGSGREFSEETRRKISEAKKGHIVSPETREKIRQAKLKRDKESRDEKMRVPGEVGNLSG